MTNPLVSEVNLTPTLTDAVSGSLAITGAASDDQIVHGHVAVPTVTVTPVPGASRLPLSSTARVLITGVGAATGVQT